MPGFQLERQIGKFALGLVRACIMRFKNGCSSVKPLKCGGSAVIFYKSSADIACELYEPKNKNMEALLLCSVGCHAAALRPRNYRIFLIAHVKLLNKNAVQDCLLSIFILVLH